MIAGHWSEQRLCGHQDTGLFRRTLANGTDQVVTACLHCGYATSPALPFRDHPHRAGYPTLEPHPEPCDCHPRQPTVEPLAAWRPVTATVDYDAYLASPQWAERRRYFLARAMHRCQLCKQRGGPNGQGLNVHHSDYSRLGSELEIDVVVLCRACHERHHGHIGEQAA